MTPKAIVEAALGAELDVIAICDHNSCRNVGAVTRAAQGKPLTVIPGIEISTSEEVHVLGLFSEVETAEAVQEHVYARLPGSNNEAVFGCQAVLDEFDMVEDLDERLLIGSVTLGIRSVVELIHHHNGLAIASHIDRKSFGIMSQLGFIPTDLELDALEISRKADTRTWESSLWSGSLFRGIASSDAHNLDDIGAAVTGILMGNADFLELSKAFAGVSGRKICFFERRT